MLSKLGLQDSITVLHQALDRVKEDGDVVAPWIDDALLEWIAQSADGDARYVGILI